jgi:hypothetical protein
VGHFISDERLIRLGHQLLCALFAAYDFPSLYREKFPYHDPDPMDDLRSLEDSDLSEQLVMLSALARANDDEHQTLSAVKKVLPDGVGTIDENGTTKVLTPREACNKIIHAKTISFEPDWSEEHPIWHRFYKRQNAEVKGKYKNPRITVTGTAQNGQGWKADINAINFLLSVSTEYWKWDLT